MRRQRQQWPWRTCLLFVFAIVALHTQGTLLESVHAAVCPTATATGCTPRRVQPASMFDPSHGQCRGKGPVTFGASPFELKRLGVIQPMGQMIGGHVTPIDHGYMFGVDGLHAPPDTFRIYSPARGTVVEMSRTVRTGAETFVDHALTIEFSCTHSIHYSNMSSFAPQLLNASGPVGLNTPLSVRVPVSEGELVGKTGKYGIDVSVWDTDVQLTGYVVPAHYASEAWKLHSADLFAYFKEPLKSKLLAKNVRQALPRFGKIDYDIDGRLIGNWFKVGTYGYAGRPPDQPGGGDYWRGHLSFAPDALDPRGFIVSLGNWQSQPKQFAAKGNRPNPKAVSVASGMVKYELVPPGWRVTRTGQPWDRLSYVQGVTFATQEANVEGVLLLKLLNDRLLKVETFPGKTAADVSGFTAAARLYER